MRTRYLLLSIVCMLYLLWLGGCGAPVNGDFEVVTYQDGKPVKTSTVSSYARTMVKHDITVVNGALSWSVTVNGDPEKRTGIAGQLDIVTANPAGIIVVKFESSLEPGGAQTVGETAVIPGLPKTAKYVKANILVPSQGAGCETPTTKQPGNWPKHVMTATYQFCPEDPRERRPDGSPVMSGDSIPVRQ